MTDEFGDLSSTDSGDHVVEGGANGVGIGSADVVVRKNPYWRAWKQVLGLLSATLDLTLDADPFVVLVPARPGVDGNNWHNTSVEHLRIEMGCSRA